VLKNDIWIRSRADSGMIKPFEPDLIRRSPDLDHLGRPVLSYGCSSYGYDIRLSPKQFAVFKHVPGTIMDPKAFNPRNLEDVELHHDGARGSYFILPAHSYGLGVALEHLAMPTNVTAICLGKSTYARMGVIANMTPAEAGWRGHLTLEFSNSSGADCRLYANEGICQLLFFEGEQCGVSYASRAGKYQCQTEQVTLARV
jgi:dCTP deaminase